MRRRVEIQSGDLRVLAELDDSDTADAIWGSLPITGKANRWGEEIYFRIPVLLPEAEDARVDMQVGELAYWPAGNAFCVFFGATPISQGDRPRAYSKVNPFGQVLGDAWALNAIKDGDAVEIAAAQD